MEFLPTLLATIAGAVFAFLGSWTIARADRKDRYIVRLDDALAKILSAVSALAVDHAKMTSAVSYDPRAFADFDEEARAAIIKRQNDAFSEFVRAINLTVRTSLVSGQLIARGEDRRILAAMTYLVDQSKSTDKFYISGYVADGIRSWRTNGMTDREVVDIVRAAVDEYSKGSWDVVLPPWPKVASPL